MSHFLKKNISMILQNTLMCTQHLSLEVPQDVELSLHNSFLKIVGPLGSIQINLPKIDTQGICFLHIQEKSLVLYVKKTKAGTGILGSLSSLLRNSFQGVSQGYVYYLELFGVGYRANLSEDTLEFQVGQSHDLFYKVPSGIRAFLVKPTLIGLYGIHKSQLTQVAAEIRRFKLPEPYKGKGIRFQDEIFVTKVGKKK
jgi:large subunit ribosomal protein L6